MTPLPYITSLLTFMQKPIAYKLEDVYPPTAKLDFPKRQPWNYRLTKEQLEQQEKQYFKVRFFKQVSSHLHIWNCEIFLTKVLPVLFHKMRVVTYEFMVGGQTIEMPFPCSLIWRKWIIFSHDISSQPSGDRHHPALSFMSGEISIDISLCI